MPEPPVPHEQGKGKSARAHLTPPPLAFAVPACRAPPALKNDACASYTSAQLGRHSARVNCEARASTAIRRRAAPRPNTGSHNARAGAAIRRRAPAAPNNTTKAPALASMLARASFHASSHLKHLITPPRLLREPQCSRGHRSPSSYPLGPVAAPA